MNIVQISYFLATNIQSPPNDFVNVHGVNIHEPDNPYFWRSLPATYKKHLLRAFFRLELLAYCCRYPNGTTDAIKSLKRCIGNLDKTLDDLWEECREASENDKMNASWRSTVFDHWLTVEYHVKRHTTKHIKNYIKTNGEDWLNVDIMTLSKPHRSLNCLQLLT